jgi:hypothetical protein
LGVSVGDGSNSAVPCRIWDFVGVIVGSTVDVDRINVVVETCSTWVGWLTGTVRLHPVRTNTRIKEMYNHIIVFMVDPILISSVI